MARTKRLGTAAGGEEEGKKDALLLRPDLPDRCHLLQHLLLELPCPLLPRQHDFEEAVLLRNLSAHLQLGGSADDNGVFERGDGERVGGVRGGRGGEVGESDEGSFAFFQHLGGERSNVLVEVGDKSLDTDVLRWWSD